MTRARRVATRAWLTLGIAAAVPCAAAASVTLDFEGLLDFESIESYYDGGFGSAGSGPGPSFGVTFNSLLVIHNDSDAGGVGNFANEPSPDGAMIGSPGVDRMFLPTGFRGTIAFEYAGNPMTTGLVVVVDAMDNWLSSVDLEPTGTGAGDPGGGENGVWVHKELPVPENAASVIFLFPGLFYFDDLTLIPPPVPALPAWALGLVTACLIGCGAGALLARDSGHVR